MEGLSLNVLRTGKRYRLTNHGETHEFVIENILPDGDFQVKDMLTLDRYYLKELTAYGKGKDYFLEEVDVRDRVE
jgi:hypothetical protein